MGKLDLPPIFCKTCGYCLYGLPENRCPECGRPFDPADPGTFRTRPLRATRRWALRAALVLLLMCAPPGGTWLWFYWGWRQEQPVLQRLTVKGAYVEYKTVGPDWVTRCMPAKAAFVLRRAQAISCVTCFPHTPASEADFRGLDTLAELESLDLSLSRATDSTMAMVGRLTRLRRLNLCWASNWARGPESICQSAEPVITARGWAALAGLHDLTHLCFVGEKLDDGAVALILRLTSLQSLTIVDGRLTDKGLLELARLPDLKQVDFSGPTVTDQGLEALKRARPGLRVNDGWYAPATSHGASE